MLPSNSPSGKKAAIGVPAAGASGFSPGLVSLAAVTILLGWLAACTHTADIPGPDDSAHDKLIDYAFIVCLGAAFQAGPDELHAAGAELKSGAWWFVENSDESPDVYEALFDSADAFGSTVLPNQAPGRCSQHARDHELQEMIDELR